MHSDTNNSYVMSTLHIRNRKSLLDALPHPSACVYLPSVY